MNIKDLIKDLNQAYEYATAMELQINAMSPKELLRYLKVFKAKVKSTRDALENEPRKG